MSENPYGSRPQITAKRSNKNINERRDIFDKIESINSNIKRMKFELSEFKDIADLDDESLDNLKKEKQQILNKLEYVMSYGPEYGRLRKEVEEGPKLINKYELRIRLLEKRQTRIALSLAKVESSISDTENGVVVKLLENIQGIYKYIQQNDTEGKCPVCSAEHGDSLSKLVELNLQSISKEVSENTNFANSLLTHKTFLETECFA